MIHVKGSGTTPKTVGENVHIARNPKKQNGTRELANTATVAKKKKTGKKKKKETSKTAVEKTLETTTPKEAAEEEDSGESEEESEEESPKNPQTNRANRVGLAKRTLFKTTELN